MVSLQAPLRASIVCSPEIGTVNLKILSPSCAANSLPSTKQCHTRLVGIDLDFGFALGAVGVAAAADMHKRLLAQVGLINVEGILFRLAVKGDKTLLVLAGLAASSRPSAPKSNIFQQCIAQI